MAVEKWTRNQTIIALKVYFSIPFNKANSSNKEIIDTAKMLGRSTNSLKMKIGNFGSFDPELAKVGIVGLKGSSKMDREIWDEFSNDKEKLAYESMVAIAKLSNKSVEEIVEVEQEYFPEGKDKLRLIKTRANQQFFRDSILGIYDSTCCITGLSIPKLLVASHIKPWAGDVKNRLNPHNGLCLNSFHDKAFDLGYITINTDYKVMISEKIEGLQSHEMAVKFFKDFDNRKITMPERYFPSKVFLEYHNDVIFNRKFLGQ